MKVVCLQHRASQQELLLVTPVQKRPWKQAHLKIATAGTVVDTLKEVFSRHGIPEIIVSDNGPQYSSELFTEFAKEYGFTHTTSSRGYPQTKGEAEQAVATVKRLSKGGEEKLQALLAYRATPLECCYSTSQFLKGLRLLRTTIPQLAASLCPHWPNINRFRK